MNTRVQVRVRGTVQGVGFRPFVYRLAREERLSGFVLNDTEGVLIEVQGELEAIDRLLARLRAEQPPLAHIEEIVSESIPVVGGSSGFEIRASRDASAQVTAITAEAATCPDCQAEIFDADDRRYRYPFTNCTNCGPRLTIVESVPYDRASTTMRAFKMCPACQREYDDPGDRRFHAQPNACPACGPSLRLIGPDGAPRPLGGARDEIEATAQLLAEGAIVAVKGFGGYHLALDAIDQVAVARLRARKHREHKPLALMVADLATAERLVALSLAERELMASPACPIVLAARRDLDAAPAPEPAPATALLPAPLTVADAVAPGALELGVMLPYTPLHHLLLADFAALTGRPAVLVMTSANLSDEPIAFHDDDARERLASIADALLVHNREIRTRVDDSVARVVEMPASQLQLLRRSRGYVPDSIALPLATTEPLLACGGELKSVFCLARGHRAWLSHHIGDLEHYAARLAYLDGIAHFEELLEIRPQVVVHDLHPDYASTQFAVGLADADPSIRLIGVQHHHAHLAGCLAEHDPDPDAVAIGAIFDGTGYGTDGTIWGGEFMVGGLSGFERVGALTPIRLPGGEAAIHEPWRTACAWFAAVAGPEAELPAGLAGAVTAEQRRAVMQIADQPDLSPLTSSIGRLFDAAGALCGTAPVATYEGQAAIEFTNLAGVWRSATESSSAGDLERYRLTIVDRGVGAGRGTSASAGAGLPEPRSILDPGPRFTLDPRPALTALLADLDVGRERDEIARSFHSAVAHATIELCALIAAERGLRTVVLSGGVFQNRRLLVECAGLLASAGLTPLTPSRLPCNDGGLSFGQAAVAARMLAAGV